MKLLCLRFPHFYKAILVIFLIQNVSCKTIVTLNLETDPRGVLPDHNLILKGYAKKTEKYYLAKDDFKEKDVKILLKEFTSLSNLALTKFLRKEIDLNTYNEFCKEAKFIIEESIYLMINNAGTEVIITYLRTGIKSLKIKLNIYKP